MYRTPLVSQQYSCGDVFTQISDYSKPMAHTCSSNFVDTCDDSETRALDTWSTRRPSQNHTMTSNKSNTVTSNGLESRLDSRLESHSYRSPTVTRHSASSSDCASLSQYSHEADADLVERLQTPQEVTLTDNPFNPLDSLHHGSHGDSLHNHDHSLSNCTSVPHLSRYREFKIVEILNILISTKLTQFCPLYWGYSNNLSFQHFTLQTPLLHPGSDPGEPHPVPRRVSD